MSLRDTGVRAREALVLWWEDIHLEPMNVARTGFIHINERTSKNVKRNLSLTKRVDGMLKERFKCRTTGRIFPLRTGPRY